MTARDISVVIPALDEEAHLASAVASVVGEAEVIVVDGGSRDRTRDVARCAGARVIESPPSRGVQLHLGAQAAAGEWLVFLHADTRLEAGWAQALHALPEAVAGGAFRFAIAAAAPAYRLVEKAVATRCRLFKLPYGDQGIFARRRAYEIVGGFPPFPLMEDVAFVRRLRRAGPLACLPQRAFTSPRRMTRLGIVGSSVSNWGLLGAYALGCSPERLARLRARPGLLSSRSILEEHSS